MRGLLESEKAKRMEEIELINFDIFYGKNYSPRLMGVFARQHHVDGIILSGSEKNTTDQDDPFVRDYYFGLKDLLDFSDSMDDWAGPPTPVLGICFGHQALACALGGETARFDTTIGVRKIQALPAARLHPLFSPLVDTHASVLDAVVYHADHVVKLPQGFRPLFTSDYCLIQGMTHDQWPIVSLQSHPEMTGLLKKDPEEAKDWEHVTLEALNTHHGQKILGRFIDWIENK